MNKQKLLLLFIAILVIILLTCLIVFYLSPFNDFAPLSPNCLPIRYPEGTLLSAENGKITSYEVEVPIQDLISFFDQNMRDPKNINRMWGWRKFGESDILFECASAANAYEAEQGCIYLKKSANTTLITSVWSHYPDSAPLCSYYIKDLKK